MLVRVTQIGAGPGEEDAIREKANDISVALNRQKPIRIEDIAFTSPAVHKLSEYLRSREGLPRLVRRGEETGGGKELTLIEFVRARMACAGFPGAARSKSANELLRFKPGEDNQYTFSYPGLLTAISAKARTVSGKSSSRPEPEESNCVKSGRSPPSFPRAMRYSLTICTASAL